jgi:alpha-L-rhamnosidase
MTMTTQLIRQADWIWIDQNSTLENQYVCFRKQITIGRVPTDSFCDIAVDSEYVLAVNGQKVSHGQFSDFPDRKTFTRINMARFLKEGKNTLCVLVHYRGRGFFGYIPGTPGLLLALQSGTFSCLSDTTWKARRQEGYRNGPVPVTSGALGFNFEYDANNEIGWMGSDLDDSSWNNAIVMDFPNRPDVTERPIPGLQVQSEVPVRLVAQGDFIRTKNEGSTARIMAEDAMITGYEKDLFNYDTISPEDTYTVLAKRAEDFIRLPDDDWLEIKPPAGSMAGRFLILDLEEETVGYLTLKVTAPAHTVLDIAHGEHLDDGRVRVKIGHCDFADRYVCKDGLNEFTYYFRRLGCRYLQVNISSMSGPVKINYIGLKPAVFPVNDLGDFQTHDTLANRTYAIGKRTLLLCMHDHFEDCPWREQALYAFDSRNQALYGYYAFGNYAFAETSFDLLGRGIRPDGFLEMCAPARIPHAVIPSFSLVWLSAVADLMLYSGQSTLFDRYAKQIEFMFEKAMAKKDDATGLYHLPPEKCFWHFYEWIDGLAGKDMNLPEDRRIDAPYNLFLLEVLRRYAQMLEFTGNTKHAKEICAIRRTLAEKVARSFWDPDKGALATYLFDGRKTHYATQVQAVALNENVLNAEQEKAVLEHLKNQTLLPTTLSSLLYVLTALMPRSVETRATAARLISENWDRMVFSGATSFWETQAGAIDFHRAGSLCHGWSALPVYYYQAWILGVRPTSPGFKTFVINPYADRFYTASGKIPTPSGVIDIQWKRYDNRLSVTASGPKDLIPAVVSFPECPVEKATYNQINILTLES